MCFFTALGVSVAAGVGVTIAETSIAAGVIGTTVVVAGVAAIGGALAGGIVSTVSAVQNAENQKKQAEYQAEVAESNAKLAYRRAENIELAANQKRTALLREAQQRLGSGRAGYAANGVVLGSGSSAEHEADLANAYDLDLKNLNYDTASASWQSKVQGVNDSNSAALYRAQAAGYAQQKTTSLLGGMIETVGSTAKTTFNVATGLAKFAPAKS